MWSKVRSYGVLLVVIIGGISLYLFDKQQAVRTVPGTVLINATVNPPTQPILFQPAFLWQDSKETRQGTGFLVSVPDGRVVGITSAHFINFDGPALIKAAWLDMRTKIQAVRFSKCFGKPGNGGTSNVLNVDLQSDYLIMLADNEVDKQWIVALDDRDAPILGEPVCFPNKDAKAELGFNPVRGHVSKIQPEYITIKLSFPVALQSQSGSPIISLTNGKVIGTLSRSAGKQTDSILLTPAKAIVNAIANAKDTPMLEKVVGKSSK
ncbi:MAG: hypothetical protein U0796_03320 [Gemmatales bacterium]